MDDTYLGPAPVGNKRSSVSSRYVSPVAADAVRQAVVRALANRRRQQFPLADVHGEGQVDPESDGSVRRYADLGQASLRQGLLDTVKTILDAPRITSGQALADQLIGYVDPETAARSHAPTLSEYAQEGSDYIGATDPTVHPSANSPGERAMYEGGRFLGGSIVPEASLARMGVNVARRVAEGVAVNSLARVERMALDYVRSPGRVVAANLTGAAGSVGGGEAAAAIDPRLREGGQLLGGLVGGAVPFLGVRHVDEHLNPGEADPASLATVAPETPGSPGIIESPTVNIHDTSDPVAPAREQAFAEHAQVHDLTPNEVREMYWTNENPELTASIRDRTNELHQQGVANNREIVGELPTSGVAPANVGTDGRLYVGEMGQGHVDVIDKFPDGVWSGETGFVTPEGKFLNRTEALQHVNNAGERIRPSENMRNSVTGDELDALDYRDQSQHVPPPRWSTRRPRAANDDTLLSIDPEATYRAERVDPSIDNGEGGQEPPLPPEEPPAPPSGDGGEPPHPSDSVVKRLTAALNSAGKVNKEQEALRSTERSQRVARAAAARDAVGGEEGLHAALGELKGEMPHLDFEGVRDQFHPEEVKSLFTRIKDNTNLRFFEQLRAGLGLKKLLDGQLPNSSELALLGRVFPKDFIAAALRNRSTMAKLKDVAANVLNIPRALMSSVDLSAPFRQGIFLVGRPEFYKAWRPMFQQFVRGLAKNDNAFDRFMDDLRGSPNYDVLSEGGMYFGDLSHDLSTREEAFMSPYAERIPVVGRLVKASERAYTAFLNKLRYDVGNSLINLHEELGLPLTDKTVRGITRFVNSATGRGNLGKFNSSGPLLNGLFFSPRLIKSRIDLLNPVFYASLPPAVRRYAIGSLIRFGAITTTVLGLAAAGGMRVETDMRSADFAKVRNGNVRYDILGGFGQYLTLGARLATNQTKSLDGQVSDLGGRYGARTRLDTLVNFGLNKESPIASFVTDYLRGRDPTGRPFNLGQETINHLTPLFVQDIVSVMNDKGPTGAAQAIPGAFGVGIQVIPPSHNIDHYGRHVADLPETEADPSVQEVTRLNTNPNSSLIGNPRRNNILVGDTRRNLTDDEYQRYQELAGRYILEDLHNETASPEWARMSDEDKRDTIRSIVRDQRANARDELFSAPSNDEYLGTGDTPLPPSDSRLAAPAGRPGRPVPSAARVVTSLFPGIHVTQEHRDPNSRLGRANPNSWHNFGRAAVDVRPIRGMAFEDYVGRIREAGYTIIQQRDEVRNPARWATGPHWHVVIGMPA